jgi:hypothetical protein
MVIDLSGGVCMQGVRESLYHKWKFSASTRNSLTNIDNQTQRQERIVYWALNADHL